MKELFSIDDLATMTMLSTRTLRTYIKQGFLNGQKIDNTWQFTTLDIDNFLQNSFVQQSVQTKRNGLVYDYLLNTHNLGASVCSIYDYPVKDGTEAIALQQSFIQKINSAHYQDLKFSYAYHKNVVRIILIGNPTEISKLIQNH